MAEPNNKPKLNKYLQLTGIAFQMFIIMFLFIWIGQKADAKFVGEDGKKYFTMLGALVGLGVSLYLILKQIKQINED